MDYSSTYALAREIRESEEYRTYHELKEQVMGEETTAALIREYRKLQVELQIASMNGGKADPEDMQRFSGISALLFSKQEVSQDAEEDQQQDQLHKILIGWAVLVDGAANGTRTRDLLITNELLYRLS